MSLRSNDVSKPPAVVPELDVTDIDESLRFYVEVCGFAVVHARPEERFVYLSKGAAELMLEEVSGPGRRFHTAKLERPFGRGMNLQIRVDDVDVLFESVVCSKSPIVVEIEDRWYRVDEDEVGNRQFVVSDPDGYLLRFFEDLGRRNLAAIGATSEGEIELSIELDPNSESTRELVRSLVHHNDEASLPEEYSPLAVFARRGGELVGGVSGYTHWGWLFVGHLWVAESFRRTGLGSQLLRRIEQVAVSRGCQNVWLDTFSFQAPSFYERAGYKKFADLSDYPVGCHRHFYRKALLPE